MRFRLALVVLVVFGGFPVAAAPAYPWLEGWDPAQALVERIAPPPGYHRVDVAPGGFADWLRRLPLKPGRPPVRLFDGSLKANQEAHFAVLDLDVGKRDLQQCADAVMRLRAEFLFASGQAADIHFNFTSGDRADFNRWAQGFRPTVRGANVRWARTAAEDRSHASLRRYLDKVFEFAGSASLSRELRPVGGLSDLRIGDVFIQGGYPGHAVIVLDLAESGDGKKVFLLAQSYMPAQEMHVLRNPQDVHLGPWYATDFGDVLRTPEWSFRLSHLARFE